MTQMNIYVATSNPGKLRDFAWAAGSDSITIPKHPFRIAPLPGLERIPPPPEEGTTFEANAAAKALYYAREAAYRDPRFAGQLVLADDSGLEVRCLNGAPGVRSARYADDAAFPHTPTASLDERNNAALLRAMQAIPPSRRQARYRCALAFVRDSDVIATGGGILDGIILSAPRGDSGFGYDPLFLIPEVDQTMAEIDPILRLHFSHRCRALRNFFDRLNP